MLANINPNISDLQLKRIFFLISIMISILLLAACAQEGISDNFTAYRGLTSQQIFEQGEQHLVKKDYDLAVADFSALDAIYPFGPYAKQGLLDSIYAYYQNSQPEMALASAERYLRLYPRGEHVDYALYLKGVIQYNQNVSWLQKKFHLDPASLDIKNNEGSFGAFSVLVNDYPHSRFAADALARMRYLRDLFARHQLIIANYYYKRHAYVAAINRASSVVVHYNGTHSIVPALNLLVNCYQRLGLVKLQDSTQRILDATRMASTDSQHS